MFEIGDIVSVIPDKDLHTYICVEDFYQVQDVRDDGYILISNGECEAFWYHEECFRLVPV